MEAWFRSNMGIIVHSLTLALVIIIAYLHLNALNPGLVKNYFYVIYFIAICYNIVAIGILGSGNPEAARMIRTYA
jgi:hypothetical protein